MPYCLRYFILYTAKREGSASASRGADAASLQWAKPAGGVADGGGYPRSILWPVDDTSPIADGLRTTPPLRWHYTREKKEKGGLGSTARTPRAISCNEEEKEEQDKEAAFNKSSSSRACGISTTKKD